MAALGKKVRFVQFNGLLQEWNQSIAAGTWDNAIVFGYILDKSSNNKVLRKIYAGRDTVGLEYIYDLDNESVWTYGNTTEGWHDSSSVITNSIGQITSGMTLGNVIQMADNGNLSRLIELMLFTESNPTINKLTLANTPGHEKESIDVYIKTSNSSSCMVTITDNHGKTILQNTYTGDIDSSTIINQLIPDTVFTVSVQAFKGTYCATDSSSISTMSSVAPVISIASIADVSANNNYRILSVDKLCDENDYTLSSGAYYYSIAENDVEHVIYDNLSLSQLKAKDLKYRYNYYVSTKHNFLSNYHYVGESPEERTFTSEPYMISEPLNVSSYIKIDTVNGQSVTGRSVIYVTSPNISIGFTVTNRLYSSNVVSVFVDDTSVTYDAQEYVDGTYTINVTLEESQMAQAIHLVLSDEYNWNSGVSTDVNVICSGVVPSVTKLNAVASTSEPKTKMSVTFEAENYVSKSIAVDDIDNNVSIWTERVVTNDNFDVSGLIPETHYKLTGKAIDDNITSVSTYIYEAPVMVSPTVQILNYTTQRGNKNTENINSINSSYGNDEDYSLSTSDYLYSIRGGSYDVSGLTAAELMTYELAYRQNYNITSRHGFVSKYHYEGIAPKSKDVESEPILLQLPLNGSSNITIQTINGHSASGTTSSNPLVISSSTMSIVVNLNPRLYSCNELSVLIDDVSIYSQVGVFTNGSYTLNTSIASSNEVKTLQVIATDEYDVNSGVSDIVYIKPMIAYGDASILKINGVDVSIDEPEKVYQLLVPNVTLNCSVNSRYPTYNSLSVYVNDVLKTNKTGIMNRGLQDVSFNLISSINDQDVYVTVGDEYDASYMTTNHIKINYNNIGGDYLMSRLNQNASFNYTGGIGLITNGDILAELPSAQQNSGGVIEAVLNPSFYITGTQAGDLLTYLDDAKKHDYVDIEDQQTVVSGGRIYYKLQFSATSDLDILFMLVPVGSTVELWDSDTGGTAPFSQRTIKKADYTTIVDSKIYDVYYDDKRTVSPSWVCYGNVTLWFYKS